MGPYSEKAMECFLNQKNVGEIEDADGVGTVGSPICGDLMGIFGCAAAVANGLPKNKLHCSVLAVKALKAAIEDLLRRKRNVL